MTNEDMEKRLETIEAESKAIREALAKRDMSKTPERGDWVANVVSGVVGKVMDAGRTTLTVSGANGPDNWSATQFKVIRKMGTKCMKVGDFYMSKDIDIMSYRHRGDPWTWRHIPKEFMEQLQEHLGGPDE